MAVNTSSAHGSQANAPGRKGQLNLVENGRIVGPARNFRFNESIIAMLNNIEAIGPTRRIHGGDLGFAPVAAPPLLVKSFTFSSRSAGI